MVIRQESKEDYEEVYDLVKEAFSTAEHADGNEQDLVAALRKSDAFIPQLSLIARINGELAGHILFTRGKVEDSEVLALAPLSVKPKYQRQGVGTALIAEGHRIAGELGFGYSLVLGSETYYSRSGYEKAEGMGVTAPEGIPSEHLMAVRLKKDAPPLHGEIVYAGEFGI